MPAPRNPEIKWLEVDDFKPGIWNEEAFQVRQTVQSGGYAPPGAAVTAKGCLARPSGALGAGFKYVRRVLNPTSPVLWPHVYLDSGTHPSWSPASHTLGTTILTPSTGRDSGATNKSDWTQPDSIFISRGGYHAVPASAVYNRYLMISQYHLGFKALGGDVDGQTNFVGQGAKDTINYAANPNWARHLSGSMATGAGYIYDVANTKYELGIHLHPAVIASMNVNSEAATSATLSPNGQIGIFPENEAASINAAQGPNAAPYWTDTQFSPLNQFHGAFAVCFHQGRIVAANAARVPSGYSMLNKTYYGTLMELEGGYGIAYSEPNRFREPYPNTVIPKGLMLGEAGDAGVAMLVSLNANTLLVVMMTGGGYLIRGDLDRPQVTRLSYMPNLMMANNQPVLTPQGVFFGSRDGLWQWTEGQPPQHVSPQMPGFFWETDLAENVYPNNLHPMGQKGKFEYSHPYVLCPKGYLFDTTQQSFWELARPFNFTGYDYSHYEIGGTGRIYAIPSQMQFASDEQIVSYDPNLIEDGEDQTWEWKSHPIHGSTNVRDLNIQELDIICSGYGKLEISLHAGEDQYDVPDINLDTSDNYAINRRVSLRSVSPHAMGPFSRGIQVGLKATGTGAGPLPTIYGFRVGFTEKQKTRNAGQ